MPGSLLAGLAPHQSPADPPDRWGFLFLGEATEYREINQF